MSICLHIYKNETSLRRYMDKTFRR